MQLKIWLDIVVIVNECKLHHPQLHCIHGSLPTRPWARLHVDFAGPMDGRMYLIVVDAHSKWLEVLPMTTATALTTIQHLRTCLQDLEYPSPWYPTMAPNLQQQSFNCFVNRMEYVIFKWRRTIQPLTGWQRGLCKHLKREFRNLKLVPLETGSLVS